MGNKSNDVKKGLWTEEEDAKILAYVAIHGVGNWSLVPKKAGLNRCGKSCRLRWTNYLRPDLKQDSFSPQEEDLIIEYHRIIGSRWSTIARKLPGRTDNDVKNHWNTKLKKRLMKMGIDPVTHKPVSLVLEEFRNISGNSSQNESSSLLTQSNSAWEMMRNSSSNYNNYSPVIFTNNNPFTTSSSSSSSSSASIITQQPNQEGQAFCWSDFLLPDPQTQVVGSSGTSSNLKESHHNANLNKIATGTASSFVDEILDKDQEMLSQFPQLLNDLDY